MVEIHASSYLSKGAIDPEAMRQLLVNPHAGGFVSFEGWVRNHNEGREVKALEYEIYTRMAEKEIQRILVEARERFAIDDCHAVHRYGFLEIGEMAVWVGAVAAHRNEAFQACQYIIDEIKVRAPVWKKEHYVDGDTQWVACHRCTSHHSQK